MAALVIKNLPDPIHKALKARARLNHRSMTREVIDVLEKIYLLGHEVSGPYMVSESRISFADEAKPHKRVKTHKSPKPIHLKTPDSPRWIDWATHGESDHPEPMKLRFKVTDESFNAAKRKGLE